VVTESFWLYQSGGKGIGDNAGLQFIQGREIKNTDVDA
jgi:hypothetical protein